MRTVKRGDIYFIAGTATTGSEQGGDRPAIIVSNDIGNRFAPIAEVVYLTTPKKAGLPTHVFIGSAERPSVALCEQIVTVSKRRIERYVGRVTEEEMDKIDKALQKSLGIHKKADTGGDAMKITINTPFGEMNFDLPPEKATDLLQRALRYATGQEAEEKTQQLPPAAPTVAQEPPKEQPAGNKPVSRVERLFGDFKATGATTKMVKVPEDGKLPITSAPGGKREPEAYSGFLLIKCSHCGKVRGFCSKAPITFSRCDCGETTDLHDLKMAFLKCKCGNQYKYKTNLKEERFDFPCLNCGSPVDLELNRRGNAYVTVGE